MRLLDELIDQAVRARASDVHIELKEHRTDVRFRVDGVMVDRSALPMAVGEALVNRIKVLGRMDIAERRLPQDGTFAIRRAGAAPVSLRAASFPAMHGEKIVLRLLIGGRIITLADLGMGEGQVEAMRRLAHSTGGLVLVTGPTGAGKTTTLYAILHELDTRRRNVVTLEDPIEVDVRHITQGQVNRAAGFGFASGLRSILRQDPDVILVGEMRDRETAEIALQASLTGHLVLSTLHTSSAEETITRLVDIGLAPWLVAHALSGIVAQRLLRVCCPSCVSPVDEATLAPLIARAGSDLRADRALVGSVGCPDCLDTGFRGRTGAFEVIEVSPQVRDLIKSASGGEALRQSLQACGVQTLRSSMLDLAADGRTTLGEALRLA